MKRLCPLLATFLTACALFVHPGSLSAKPVDFDRPRMMFSLGIDAFDYFVGNFGDAADVGLSLYGEVAIQVGYFGGSLRFGSSRAFTNKDFLPYDEGLQHIFITAAPRLYIPLYKRTYLYLILQPQASIRFLQSNTLVTITGNDSLTGAAGGSLGLQFITGIISITGLVALEYDFRLSSILLTGGLSIGLTSTIN